MKRAVETGVNGQWMHWAGTDYRMLVRKGESAGTIGMFESAVRAGEGPPIHVHHNEDEVIHVLEGRYQFWLDGVTTEAGPGSSIFLPRGVPHTFRVIGAEPGRNIAVLTPGGFESFFEQVSSEALNIPQDMERIAAIAAGYGLEFVGPPLAAQDAAAQAI